MPQTPWWESDEECRRLMRSIPNWTPVELIRAAARRAQTTAWLIEWSQDGMRSATWWTGNGLGAVNFSEKADDAICFSRRKDAEIALNLLLQISSFVANTGGFCVTEHEWYDNA